MIHTTMILCIVGAMLTLQVEACRSAFELPQQEINKVSPTINDLSNFISNQKVNLDMKLIEMKVNGTYNIMMIVVEAVSLLAELTFRIEEKEQNKKFYIELLKDILNASTTTSNHYKKCVKNQFDILKPVENDIQNFLNDRKSCLLNIDSTTILFCSLEELKDMEGCVGMMNNINSSTMSTPTYECDTYTSEQKSLEENAKLFAFLGESYASICIQSYERKFNITIEEIMSRAQKHMPEIV